MGAGAALVFDGGEVGSRAARGLKGPPGPPGIYADVGVLEAPIARLERPLHGLGASVAERRLSGVERRLRGARARSQGKRAVVWAVGDGADGGVEAKAVAARVASERPDHFLYLGDVYADGTAEEFERNYRSVYGQLDRITAPSPGNHEWPNAEEGYGPYWRRAKGRTMPSYYSFRAGRWQLLSLNSEAPHDEDSAQVRWLRRAVAEPGTCRIAFWHRARFSGGKHGDQNDLEPPGAPCAARLRSSWRATTMTCSASNRSAASRSSSPAPAAEASMRSMAAIRVSPSPTTATTAPCASSCDVALRATRSYRAREGGSTRGRSGVVIDGVSVRFAPPRRRQGDRCLRTPTY